MAVIDDYFFELEGQIEKAKSEEEIKILQREARSLFFSPENGKGIADRKYKGELQRHFIDEDALVGDLADLGLSYRAFSRGIGLKAHNLQRESDECFILLTDENREKMKELTGLDIMSYTIRTETAGRQPLRQVNADLIKKAMKEKGLKAYKLSGDIHGNSGALTNHLKRKEMPLHIAMELCDMLGLDHDDVIVEEGV